MGGVVFDNLVLGEEEEGDIPSILGTSNTPQATGGASAQNLILLGLFLAFVSTYLAIRIVKKREYLAELFAKGLSFKERVYSFRLFLL